MDGALLVSFAKLFQKISKLVEFSLEDLRCKDPLVLIDDSTETLREQTNKNYPSIIYLVITFRLEMHLQPHSRYGGFVTSRLNFPLGPTVVLPEYLGSMLSHSSTTRLISRAMSTGVKTSVVVLTEKERKRARQLPCVQPKGSSDL